MSIYLMAGPFAADSAEAAGALKSVEHYVESYNFDDSDGGIDYFHCNFYVHARIGQWDKPLVNTAE